MQFDTDGHERLFQQSVVTLKPKLHRDTMSLAKLYIIIFGLAGHSTVTERYLSGAVSDVQIVASETLAMLFPPNGSFST